MKRRNTDTCETWPECSCAQKWQHWTVMLPRMEAPGEPPDPELIEIAREDLVFMLSCVAEHCPDRSKRRHAINQLLHPYFAEKKAELERPSRPNFGLTSS